MLQATRSLSSAVEAPIANDGRASGHSRVTDALRQRIASGDWAPGAAIPGRRHLAKEYNVSPATIERAIVPLLADGTLRADDRRGTFVAETVVPVAQAPVVVPVHRPVRVHHQEAPASGFHLGPVAIVAPLYAPDCRDIGQNDQWVRDVVGAMENELAEHGRHTTFINRVPRHAPEPMPLQDSLRQALEDGSLSGLSVIAFDLEPWQIEEAYEVLGHCRFPVVSVVSGPLSLPVPHVVLDNHRAGFQAARFLLERGHRTLTVVLPERAGWSEERLAGIRAAVDRARLPMESVVVIRGEDLAWDYNRDPMEVAARAINKAFEGGWKPLGPVLCASDMVALVLMDALTERGYAVGTEIPVLGFDDHEFSRDSGLTSMRPPTRAMGVEAARLLLAGEDSRSNGCQVRLCSKLIPRKSTAAAPKPSQGLTLNQGPAHTSPGLLAV